MTDLTFLRPLVANTLAAPSTEWTVQGFGFLRTYFGPSFAPKHFRLNLWDHRFTVPNVSTIHDHPWDFKSLIVAGEIINQRYSMAMMRNGEFTHHFTTIKTGEGGGMMEKAEIEACVLNPKREEVYHPGDIYRQKASTIHETIFEDGTVTLNERVGDTQHARVFWPFGTDWVDARPRPATADEVRYATRYSLSRWF